MRKLLFPLTTLITIISCQNQTKTDKQIDAKTETINLIQKNEAVEKEKADSIAKINNEQRVENKKRLEILKKNFNFKKDEFNNTAWYRHKNQTVNNSWNRKCLITHINSDGYIYLEDQFYSDDWIFHSSIHVKIADNIYNSSVVETYEENNKTENSGGSIWENISYTDGKDNGIIKAIAESGNKLVKVRFVGKQYNSDFTLSNKDKKAIKEGYELAYLIKTVGK